MKLRSSMMKVLLLLAFTLHLSSAGTHSLRFFYTAVTPGINFPEFTAVSLLDGHQITYYDSNIRRKIPKTEWMKKITADVPDYWNRFTRVLQHEQEIFKDGIADLMRRFNQTAGVHVVQQMYCCELDDDGTIRGFNQHGYDGADFISLDLKTLTYTAANNKALISKHRWETADRAPYWKNYLENKCIEWLRKYVIYGKETLERKDPPEASLFQKLSSAPELVCQATGFFPKDITMSWQKNGEDVDEDVELLETLPNNDGSFQKRIILRVSPEELQKHDYTCVIQHSSMKEDLVLKATPDGGSIWIIVGVVVGLIALVLCPAGILIWKKKKSDYKPAPSRAGSE